MDFDTFCNHLLIVLMNNATVAVGYWVDEGCNLKSQSSLVFQPQEFILLVDFSARNMRCNSNQDILPEKKN